MIRSRGFTHNDIAENPSDIMLRKINTTKTIKRILFQVSNNFSVFPLKVSFIKSTIKFI